MSGQTINQATLAAVVDRMRGRSETAGPVAPLPRYDTAFTSLPAYRQMAMQRDLAAALGLADPYYHAHQGIAGATSRIHGREIINFASYDYLGLSGDPRVADAITTAVRNCGSSVSASRISAGERGIHRQLEQALAELYSAEAAALFVSGHATAISTLSTLLGPKDIIIYDSLIHNCIAIGAQLSGAARRAFPHNDLDALETLLASERDRYDRAMIVVEGLYSMDGDGIDLARLVEMKRRWGAWLMVDDAHGLGVLGATGRGSAEHANVDAGTVDIWFGTLSKTLVSCGGYIAGSAAMIDLLKHLAPGLVYSVGLPAGQTAAALTALDIMKQEPERVLRLQENGRFFLDAARAEGLDTGASLGKGIIPVFVGDTPRAVSLATKLLDAGINAFPILPPGVPERTARLRFFVTATHSREQLAQTVSTAADLLRGLALPS